MLRAAVRTLRAHRRWVVAGVLAIALVLRVGQVERSSYVPINDAHSYLTLAASVARTGDYSTSTRPGSGSGGTRGPDALFPPAYPYFLALVDRVDGQTTAGRAAVGPARISQAILGTLTVGLIGLLALELFGPDVGLVALGLAAIYPVLIETSGTLLAENLFVVFELAAVLCGLRARRSARLYRWAAVAGGLAGLAALTHQDGLLLLPPLAVAVWRPADGPASSRKRSLAAPAVLVIALGLTIAPWTVRNAVELHRFLPISDQTGETLLGTYNAASAADPQIPYRWLWPSRIPAARALVAQAPRLTEADWENRLLSRAVHYIGSHPTSLVAATFHNSVRLVDLEGSFAWEASAASIGLQRGTAEVGVIGFWIVAVLALLGALTRVARRAPGWVWAVPILLLLGTVWVRVETPRFRLPLDPFLVLLAACALTTLASRLRLRVSGGAPDRD